MNIIKCYQTNSACYKRTSESKKIGIIVHSTGANNPYLRRYVQPAENDPYKGYILDELGLNNNHNDYNHADIRTGVHAFIGKNKNNEIRTVLAMPYEKDAWGCGSGSKGSFNYSPLSHIQFEICEDNLKNSDYFYRVMTEAQQYCASLCIRFNWKTNVIISHAEANKKGYASNHGDPDHWLKIYNKDMNWFRERVWYYMDLFKDLEICIKILEDAGIITNPALWLRKGKEDIDIYWLIKKMSERVNK